ncbi:MAG: CDP-alcohol phosphatidyltransferase family protein, partial [Rhodoglobus sp.]
MRGRVARNGDTPASTGNVANIVTVVRIFMAPVFIWLLLADKGELGAVRWVAAVIFVVAIVTDTVDGILARRQNLVTDFGKILDPIADKVLTGGALVALSILGELWWWVTIVILIREFGITI